MKQKLGLACALIHTPKVLFLDEPTNGVDPVSRRDFWRILYQLLREKVTIFVSTAYLDEAERCNRVALIHRGKLLACGTPDEVKKLMRGAILEVRAAEPRQGRRRAAGKMSGRLRRPVRRPRPRGQRRGRSRPPRKSRRRWPPPDCRRSSIRPIEPSLEDVFVSVLARRGREQVASDGSGCALESHDATFGTSMPIQS